MNYVLVLIAVIGVVGAFIAYIGVPYFKQNTTEKQRNEIYFWVKIAVQAFEQIYKEKGQGALKKEKVLEFINSKGYNISKEELNLLIEAAVKELDKIGKELQETDNIVNVYTEDYKELRE